MMRRSRLLLGDEEPGLRLRSLTPGQARGPKRLVPWWVRAERRLAASRVTKRLPKTSREGGGRHKLGRSATGAYGRRSVVKASFRRNRHNGGWAKHARYLTRERAQLEHGRGLGFDREHDGLDMVATVREWERGDQLVWSMILSPEDAERLDLRRHARDFVAGMEQDLGTTLEWVAIDHHNTDDAHIHLLIRGVRDNGKVLNLDRDYIMSGLRELSQELIERELGPRLEHEVLLARGRTIEREQWTEIDRALERRLEADRIVSYERFEPHSEGAKVRMEQEIERLQFLEKLELARRISERSWELSVEHEAELRKRQREHDILKTRARERQRERDKEREKDRDRGMDMER
jgi:type IV secretory pathway VirD2 relaxase